MGPAWGLARLCPSPTGLSGPSRDTRLTCSHRGSPGTFGMIGIEATEQQMQLLRSRARGGLTEDSTNH